MRLVFTPLLVQPDRQSTRPLVGFSCGTGCLWLVKVMVFVGWPESVQVICRPPWPPYHPSRKISSVKFVALGLFVARTSTYRSIVSPTFTLVSEAKPWISGRVSASLVGQPCRLVDVIGLNNIQFVVP